MKKADLTLGIGIGIILTFLGSYIHFQMTLNRDIENTKRDYIIETCELLDSRLIRSNGILQVKNSNILLFEERWSQYIVDVINPWNNRKYLIKKFVVSDFPEHEGSFNSIAKSLKEIHNDLVKIRQKKIALSREKGAKHDSIKISFNYLTENTGNKIKYIESSINLFKKNISREMKLY